MKYAYYHREDLFGTGFACGGIAFYLTAMPEDGEDVNPDKAFGVNGERFNDGDPVICGTCGKQIFGLLPIPNIEEVE